MKKEKPGDLDKTQTLGQHLRQTQSTEKLLQTQGIADLETTIKSKTSWLNIQDVVRLTFCKTFTALKDLQQTQEKTLIDLINLKNELRHKADISDVSQAMTEVIIKVDSRKQVENLLVWVKQNQSDQRSQENEFKAELKQLQMTLLSQSSDQESLRLKIDETKRDQTRLIAQVYRDIEKQQSQISIKNQHDILKQMELNFDQKLQSLVQNENLKRGQLANNKADLEEVQLLVKSIEAKFEDEFRQIQEQLQRRASADDLQFYRREQSFKVSKDEVETLRHDLSERILQLQQKVSLCQEQVFQSSQNSITEMDQRLTDTRAKLSDRFEDSLSQMSNQFSDKLTQLRSYFTSIQIHQNTNQNVSGRTDAIAAFEELRLSMRKLVESRQEDIQMISLLLNSASQKLKQDFKTTNENQFQVFKESISAELEDKVRVDEVKGALQKLTESFRSSIQQVEELNSAKIAELDRQSKQYIDSVVHKYESVIAQLMRPQDEIWQNIRQTQQAIETLEKELKAIQK